MVTLTWKYNSLIMELEVLRVMVGLLNEEEKVDPVRQSGESIGGERVSFI